MAVVRWEPFRELAAFQNEMSRLMGRFGETPGNGHSSGWIPSVDVWETENDLVLSFDLPGIAEDDVSIEIEKDVLTVSGERERTAEISDERYYRFEKRYGSFQRSVGLPTGIDESAITANFDAGVLQIRVPKPEEQKPKRIQIGTKGAIEGKGKRQ